MAEIHELKNVRTRAANSEVGILAQIDYWRTDLHERGLVMGRAASAIKLLREQARESTPKRSA